MENPHLFWVSKCGKTDRVPSLNSKRKTAQNRMVEPQIYGVPEKSKTFWGEEERRRERADDFLKRKSRRERYIVRNNDGRGRRTWSRLPARSVLLHTLYAEVSTGDPLLACRLGRCFCILCMQRSPQETRTPRHSPSASFSFFVHTKNSKHRKSGACCFGRGRRT